MNSWFFGSESMGAMIVHSGKQPQLLRTVFLSQRAENPTGLEASGKGARSLRAERQTVLEIKYWRLISPTYGREIGRCVSEPCGLRISRQAVQLGRPSFGGGRGNRADLRIEFGSDETITLEGDDYTRRGEERQGERYQAALCRTSTASNGPSGRCAHRKVEPS